MLQRIQTIFLALVMVGMGVFLSFPIWFKIATTGNEHANLTAMKLTHQLNDVQSNIRPTYYLLILALLVAGVAAYTIFQYKNRVLQSALCAVNSILMTIIIGLVVYFTYYSTAKLFDPTLPGEYDMGFYGLVAAMLSNVFANRFIRRDEKVVHNANRLR